MLIYFKADVNSPKHQAQCTKFSYPNPEMGNLFRSASQDQLKSTAKFFRVPTDKPCFSPLKILVTTKKKNKRLLRPQIKSKIKSLYSPYYAEACNELRGPSPRLSAWATQLRRNVATVASRWRHCANLTGPGIEPRISRTDSVRLATELFVLKYKINEP